MIYSSINLDNENKLFKINLSNYFDAEGNGQIEAPFQKLESVSLNNNANLSGYNNHKKSVDILNFFLIQCLSYPLL